MPIDVSGVPQGTLVPFAWFQVEPASQPGASIPRILLIGQRVGGSVADNVPVILSDTKVEEYFGRASMIAAMYRHARAISKLGEIWGISWTPDSGDVRATASIAVADPGTKSGPLTIRIGETLISIFVAKTDGASDVAHRLSRKINGNAYCAFSADVATSGTTVNLTCKWKGESGNRINIDDRWWGHDRDLANHLTITDPANGTGGGGVADALAALNDQPFKIFCLGLQNDNALQAMGDFLDGDSGRWSPSQQLYGHAAVCSHDSFANLITKGNLYNDPHLTLLGAPGGLTPEWCWAAELAAQMQIHYGAPPEVSRPLQGLPLSGVTPAFKDAQWFDVSERQSLYEAGIAGVRVDQYRNVLIDRDVTTYKTNLWGDLDISWRDGNTLFQVMCFVEAMHDAVTSTFPRAALTDEDTGIPGFTSPGQIKDLLIHTYIALEKVGLVENSALFAKYLVVERDTQDPTRVNALIPPDMVNQLRIFAALVQTHLQLTDDNFTLAAA